MWSSNYEAVPESPGELGRYPWTSSSQKKSSTREALEYLYVTYSTNPANTTSEQNPLSTEYLIKDY
jgi:hypothetical protein